MSAFFSLQQYLDADCMQLEGPARVIGIALYRETAGRMCGRCPKYRNNCKALNTMSMLPTSQSVPVSVETVREEALRRNIGIKEVRRQRNARRLA